MSTVTTWAKDVALRAVKTAAQAAVAAVTANTAGITHLDLAAVGAVSGLAAVVCVLQNLATINVSDPSGTVTSSLAVVAQRGPDTPPVTPVPVVWPPVGATGDAPVHVGDAASTNPAA